MGRSNNDKLVEKCKDEKEMKLFALMVLEVFERAGNFINQYLQSDAYNDVMRPRLEIAREIQNLLQKVGFVMNPKDTDLNDTKCFSVTSDPVDHTSLPLLLRPHEFFLLQSQPLGRGRKDLAISHEDRPPPQPLNQSTDLNSETIGLFVEDLRSCKVEDIENENLQHEGEGRGGRFFELQSNADR
ncbi:hypothetical protein V6N13_123401 [Hibiscus sabdariffa]